MLLSKGNKNIEKVYELSKKGQVVSVPTDILKELYVFEFLGIKEEKPMLESNLEKKFNKSFLKFSYETW